MRKYCIDCCKKHLGSAAVLEDEVYHGYPQYELYVLGHLDQAASEIQGINLELAETIRQHRIHWLENHDWEIPYEELWTMLDVMKNLSDEMARTLNVTPGAMGKLAEGEDLPEVGDTRKPLPEEMPLKSADDMPAVTDGFVQTISVNGKKLDDEDFSTPSKGVAHVPIMDMEVDY